MLCNGDSAASTTAEVHPHGPEQKTKTVLDERITESIEEEVIRRINQRGRMKQGGRERYAAAPRRDYDDYGEGEVDMPR